MTKAMPVPHEAGGSMVVRRIAVAVERGVRNSET